MKFLKAAAEERRAATEEKQQREEIARREQEDATRAKAREEEARRAANRAVAEARAIAERRVAEAVRDERLRAERKAREARLANAAARRRGEEGALPGSSWGAPPSATRSGADKYSPSGSAVAFFGAGGDLASFRARTRAAELESAEREAWAKAKQREVAPLERAESEEDPRKAFDALKRRSAAVMQITNWWLCSHGEDERARPAWRWPVLG